MQSFIYLKVHCNATVSGMMQEIDLKEIERKAYTSYHQDGLIDIFIAFSILSFGVGMMLDMAWLGSIFFISGVSLYAAAKKAFTVPRIGFVKFAQHRVKVMQTLAVGLLSLLSILGAVTFMMVESGTTPSWLLFLIEYHMPVIGVSVAALFCAVGYTFRPKRMYAYALLTLVMFVAGYFVSYPLPYYVILLGALILLSGLIMLIRFIHRYPFSDRTNR